MLFWWLLCGIVVSWDFCEDVLPIGTPQAWRSCRCFSSVGSRLSVWCLLLRRLAILSGSRCCAVSCINGLTCSLIVRCNFVYVLLIVVDTSVMFKSVCSVSFLAYQGALVIRCRTRFWNLCIVSVVDAEPHIAILTWVALSGLVFYCLVLKVTENLTCVLKSITGFVTLNKTIDWLDIWADYAIMRKEGVTLDNIWYDIIYPKYMNCFICDT
jgi:hypothetical protein